MPDETTPTKAERVAAAAQRLADAGDPGAARALAAAQRLAQAEADNYARAHQQNDDEE
jgi:hypothetical protein